MNDNNLPGFLLLILSTLGLFYMGVISKSPFESMLFPMLLMGILLVCSLTLLIKGFKHRENQALPNFNWKKVLTLIILGLAYVYLMDILGFIVATLLFLVAFLFVAGLRKPVQLIGITLGTTFGVYFIFEKILQVYLP